MDIKYFRSTQHENSDSKKIVTKVNRKKRGNVCHYLEGKKREDRVFLKVA